MSRKTPTHTSRKRRHPRRNFKLRQYIASRSIWQLTLVFIAINAVLAVVLALVLAVVTRQPDQIILYIYSIYTELFGKEPRWSLPDHFMYQNIRALLATLSLLSPALFMGTIIYKFFVLKKDNIVFRPQCDLSYEDDGHYLNIYFYISSSLRLYNLKFEAFLRTYESRYECGSQEYYPMNTYPLALNGDAWFPLPFNYVPSRFRVRLKQHPGPAGHTGEPDVLLRAKGVVEVVTPDRRLQLNPAAGDFCELYLVASGEVPDLQTRFNEVHCYRLPEDVSAAALPAMQTQFNRQQERFTVSNWEDFDRSRKSRRQRRADDA